MSKPSITGIIFILVTLAGCIERYYPDEEDLQTGTLVVVAHLNNLPGIQSVYISRSTALQAIRYDPVSWCFVEVERADGSSRVLEESAPGEYSGSFSDDFLITGEDYRLIVVTPDGKYYESGFEKMLPAQKIQSVYHTIEERYAPDPADTEEGIRFFIDFEIDKDSGRYLFWQLTETYEIHNPEYPVKMYDVDRRMKDVPDSVLRRNCWITGEISEIFTKDLGNVEGSVYREMPLNFVSSKTRKLQERYSLLVQQYTLTSSAFWYWNELGKNLQSKGNLFDTQPSLTPSNICNIDDENEKVIGYFSISGVSETRIFIDNVPGLSIYQDPDLCAPGVYPMFLHRYPRDKLPIYLATATSTGLVDKKCVDCREYKGSTDIKPDFW